MTTMMMNDDVNDLHFMTAAFCSLLSGSSLRAPDASEATPVYHLLFSNQAASLVVLVGAKHKNCMRLICHISAHITYVSTSWLMSYDIS